MIKKLHILLVEDNWLTRTVLSDYLTRKGYAVFQAENGLEGLRILEHRGIDLVITDYSMPHMGGKEFILDIKKNNPCLPVILVSGFELNEKQGFQQIKSVLYDFFQNRSIWDSLKVPSKKYNRRLFMNKILVVIVMLVLFAQPVFGGTRGRGPGKGMGMGYGLGSYGMAELNLTPDQGSKLKALQSDYLRSLQVLQRELMIKRSELRVMDSRPTEEIPRLNRLRLEIQDVRKKIREIWLNYKMECQALLTSEQLEQLGSMERGRRQHPGMGWGNR